METDDMGTTGRGRGSRVKKNQEIYMQINRVTRDLFSNGRTTDDDDVFSGWFIRLPGLPFINSPN